MKRDFLLEIGCENLPSVYLDGILGQLRSLVEASLKEARLPVDRAAVLGTPKRLVVHLAGVAPKQEASESRFVGPPVKAGVAPDGSYTKAAEGFARSQGVPVERLQRVQTDRGEYLAVLKRVAGRASTAVLAESVTAWVESIRSPKTMRWNASGAVFARPIRWILCLYGDRVLRVRVAGCAGGGTTRLSPLFVDEIAVKSPAAYFALMKRHRIVLDPAERRRTVRTEAERLARECGGELVADEELAGIVADLLEAPVPLAGRYDAAFLALPREVIVTALKSHQRYFSVSGPDGSLVPYFVAFADGARRNASGIARGYERVLRARLDDAVFYFREDTAQPLERMAEKLGGIVWLEGLGTLAEKARRVESLALLIARGWGMEGPEVAARVSRAARLAKADLASEMVKDGKEFTALQGYIGREYARASGEEEEVAEAIFEHYLPRFAGDRVPERRTSVLVALADKIDTIVGCFVAGVEPTGSQDPYGLRRQALGVLRIALQREATFSLDETLRASIALFGSGGAREPEALLARLRDFLGQRLYTLLRGDGVDHDLVAAALGAPWEYPRAVAATVESLRRMRADGSLPPFALAMKRIANIIPKDRKRSFTPRSGADALEALASRATDALGFSPDLFVLDAEKGLYEATARACELLRDARRSGASERSIEILNSLVPSINKYFDDVLVNCEEEKLRNNRISFLLSTYMISMLFCDFTQIAGE